jgi:hypothetical protein
MSRKKWVGAFSGDNKASPLTEDEKQTLGQEDIVLLLSGFNHNGDKIFNYLKIPLENVEKIIAAVNAGGRFDIREYGEVIAAGLGQPSDDLRKEMEETYKMINFPKPNAE